MKVPIYRDIENRLPKGEGVGGGMEWAVRVNRCKLLHIGWINKKGLLYRKFNILVETQAESWMYEYNNQGRS